MEKFDPFKSEYKKVIDLPDEERKKFKDVEGGFVRESVIEDENNAADNAKVIREMIDSGLAEDCYDAEKKLSYENQKRQEVADAENNEKCESDMGLRKKLFMEKMLGLYEDVVFEDVLAEELNYNHPHYHVSAVEDVLRKNGVNVNAQCCPSRYMQDFDERDWDNIRRSENPIVAIHAAEYYHRLRSERERSRKYSRPMNQIICEKIFLRTLPLIHGTSAEGLLKILNSGKFVSNKELYKKNGSDSNKFLSGKNGQTNLWDRELGLDQYVFADFARPHMYHKQEEITLVIDPEVMKTPGVFMTEKDIADCDDEKKLQEYLYGATTPDYFYDSAEMRINDSVISSRYNSSHGVDVERNSVYGFAAGMDSDVSNLGGPTFSTWEVKLPEIPITAIKRIIIRDKDKYEQLSKALTGDFDIVFEPALGRENYGTLCIPGKLEKEYLRMEKEDYQRRISALEKLSDNEKEVRLAILPSDAMKINFTKAGRLKREFDEQTNPYWVEDCTIYNNFEQVIDDIKNTDEYASYGDLSRHKKSVWFRLGPYEIMDKECFMAVYECSKADNRIGRILELKRFNPANI